MADEFIPPPEDAKEERDEAFFASLGISRFLYIPNIRTSIIHARAVGRADVNRVPWRLWGARNIGGRIRDLAQNPRNPQILYAGSAQGGVFKSSNGGDTWLPLGGPENSLPVGALGLAPSNPNVLYIGTGEPGVAHTETGTPPVLQARQLFAAGIGLIRFDESAPAFPGPELGTGANSFFRIVVDPNDATADRCWIACHTGLWRRDTGPSYTREPVNPPLPVAPALGACATDVAVTDNGDGSYRVLAAIAGVGIFRGRFTAAPLPSTAWEPRLTRGLPDPITVGSRTFDRTSLAVCKSQPNHVYALMETGDESLGSRHVRAVYHSSDGGTNWKERSVNLDMGEQTWVDLGIAVHPDNPALVIIGVVDLARSFDYGKSWHKIIHWPNFNSSDRAQHGDQHAIHFDVANPHRLWVTNDGGISLATDIVQSNPLTDRTWRKRSDGLAVSQFHDITVHPQFPFIAGGGLQDNATYVSFGGRTWYPVGDADGGEMAFEVRDPRSYIAPNQARIAVSRVVPGITEDSTPGSYPLILRSPTNADQTDFAREIFAVRFRVEGDTTIPGANKAQFIPIVEKHPTIPGHLIVGRALDGFVSTDFGSSYSPLGVGIPHDPSSSDDQQEAVSAIAYAPAHFWLGTDRGRVWRGLNTSPPTAWTDVTPLDTASPPAPIYGSVVISRILVHPSNPNYVVFCTARQGRGRVFLSLNQGGTWSEISGLSAVATVGTPPPAPGGPAPALTDLPPCPVTSLAFDISVDPALPQTLFAGTLAGVYVIRGLPPATAAAVTAFYPQWRTFNGPIGSPPGLGQLPLTLVNNLVTVKLDHTTLAPPGALERVDRYRLIVAMYGRGIFACDITPASASPPYPPGGPPHRFFIRQHLIEDGLTYPRPDPAILNTPASPAAGYLQPELDGDPRFPAGTVSFTEVSAWDIRVDNAPFQVFGEVLDGVEFDTELRSKNLAAGERNIVYVQVQTAGWGEAAGVDVHLFFAEVAPGSPVPAVPEPNLQPDFWNTFRVMPVSPPGLPWARAAATPAVTVHPNDPIVVRFDWLVPRELGGKTVGLLAICEHSPLDRIDETVMPADIAQLVRRERRAAYRRVAVTRFTPDIYLRDSVEDDGTLGAVAFGGRSPDIIVVASRPANLAEEFADLLDAHAGDRLIPGPATNFIYVRVHNRREIPILTRVELLFVKPVNPALAMFDPANWSAVAPISPPASGEVLVPPLGHAMVEFVWNAAPPPDAPAGVMPALGLIALAQSVPEGADPRPVFARVRDVSSFWQFFRKLADSNNAALRMVLYP
jgi:hypothetical protein